MRPIATDGIARSVARRVCLSVCLSVTTVSPAKAAMMPFSMWTQVGPVNHVSSSPHVKGQFWGQKGASPLHAWSCLAVDRLKATQQGYARWGAHYTPFTRYNRFSNRLYNRFDNRLYLVNKHPKWRWWMWMVAAIYRRTHSPSWLAWSEGWQPPGA